MCIHFYIGANIHQSHGSLGFASIYAVEQRCRHSPIPRIRGIDACAYIFTSELTFINPTDPWDWQVVTQLSNDADIHQSHESLELASVYAVDQGCRHSPIPRI